MHVNDVVLAGQLGTDDEQLYLTPGGTTAIVQDLSIHNAAATSATALFWIETAGGASVYRVNVTLDAGHTLYPAVPFMLPAACTLHGESDTDAVIHYYLSIQEQTR